MLFYEGDDWMIRERKDNMKKKIKNKVTAAVHGGEKFGEWADSLTTPIFQTSTYVFKNSEEIRKFASGARERYEYARYGNPTQRAAEEKLAELEGTEDCLLFDSGMSAVSSTLLAFLSSGDHMVTVDDAYKKTLHFCSNVLPRFGIGCSVVPMGDYAAMEEAVSGKTKILYSESPTNPYLNIADFEKLREIKERHGLLLIIDSTFGTPYNQHPADWGAEIVIHSATKYLGGHNDLLAGAVLGGKEAVGKVRDHQGTVGGIIEPHAAYLLLRGIKTFGLRMERHNSNGMAVARFLMTCSHIRRVYYPGLESHRDHAPAARQMKGFGGVVTFELDTDIEGVYRFLDGLKLCKIAPSLGGVESLITNPASLSYSDVSREERLALGITDGLVRLSVGIEDPEDITGDLKNAFDRI